jgi:hypothetical protein
MRSLHNPLQRQERLSTGWFGVICSFDGVLVEDTHHAHARAWLQVAEEMNLPRPLGQTLNRIKGARDEVVSGNLPVLGLAIIRGAALGKPSSLCMTSWVVGGACQVAVTFSLVMVTHNSVCCLVCRTVPAGHYAAVPLDAQPLPGA